MFRRALVECVCAFALGNIYAWMRHCMWLCVYVICVCRRVRHYIKRACVCSHYCLPVFVEAMREFNGVILESLCASLRPIIRQPPFSKHFSRCRVRVLCRSYVFPLNTCHRRVQPLLSPLFSSLFPSFTVSYYSRFFAVCVLIYSWPSMCRTAAP